MNKEYKGYKLYKGYPSRFALQCWIAEQTGHKTLYARTLKEIKGKIDTTSN